MCDCFDTKSICEIESILIKIKTTGFKSGHKAEAGYEKIRTINLACKNVYIVYNSFYLINQMIIYCKQMRKRELVEFAYSHVREIGLA